MDKMAANATSPDASKFPWRGSWLLIVAGVCLAVFFWLPSSYIRMVGWPWLLVWQLGFLAAGILAVWMLRQSHRPFHTLGYGFDWVVGLFVIAILLSMVSAPVPQLSLWYAAMAGGYVFLLYVLRNWVASKPQRLHQLWLGIVAVGLGTNVVSLALWRPSPSMWLSDNFHDAVRNAMPLGHHNFVGGFEVLMLPLAVTLTLARTGWPRWLGGVASLLSFAVLVVSGSRGALLGAMAMTLVAALILIYRARGRQRLVFSGLGILAVLGMAALALTNPRTRNALAYIFDPQPGQANPLAALLQDGPILDRWQMLQTGGNILADQPLTGVGLGNMARVFSLYRPITMGPVGENIQQLHNTPAQLLGELGLLGGLAFLALLACLGWLWLRLGRQPLSQPDRWLLRGAGIGLIGYGISGLTDYQLENIPISALITFDIAVFLGLAILYIPKPPMAPWALPQKLRRWISLASLVVLGVVSRIWIPVDAAAYLANNASAALLREDFIQADAYLQRAAQMTPWDPIPSLLAAHSLRELASSATAADQEALRAQAIEYYRQAVSASPNDAWLHNNLANLLLRVSPQQAEVHASRTVQLVPRERSPVYFQLSLAFLLQDKNSQATDALALELLTNPTMVTMEGWQEVDELMGVKDDVIATTTELYDELFSQLDLTLPKHQTVYEQGLLVRWWQDRPLPAYDAQHLRPIVQAVFLAETNPEAALSLLNERIQNGNAEDGELLLRAWLQPELHLDTYLQDESLSAEDVDMLRQSVIEHRNLRSWLNSEMVALPGESRLAMFYTYRSPFAQGASDLFHPQGVGVSAIAVKLGLFKNHSRSLVPLDELVNQYRTDALGLPHPTQSGFMLLER